jgi:cyclophilin family peptidyl-prolyl cis-trans isomerase
VDVNVPRIGRRSLVLRVTKGTRVNVVERLNARLDETTGRFVWHAGDVRKLAPGASLEETVTSTALEVGSFTVLPMYSRMGAKTATAEPIRLEVQPGDGKSSLGARIVTTKGEVVVRLRPDLAFNTVESFVSLIRRGYYDGLTFHRIIPGFMAQGGCPQGNGRGDPGYMLPLEAHTKLLHDRGVLSMARTGIPDTAGSQFFLMFARKPDLDPGYMGQPGYTVFGQMVSGDSTLDALAAVGSPNEAGTTRERVEIKSARIELLE